MRPTGRVITTVAQVEQDARIHEKRGADRERGRIRRALKRLERAHLGTHWATCICAACALFNAINDATRSRGKAKR